MTPRQRGGETHRRVAPFAYFARVAPPPNNPGTRATPTFHTRELRKPRRRRRRQGSRNGCAAANAVATRVGGWRPEKRGSR